MRARIHEKAQGVHRPDAPLLRRESEPSALLREILLRAGALSAHCAGEPHGVSVPELRGLSEMPEGLCGVLRDADAAEVHLGKAALRVIIALRGAFPVALRRHPEILRRAIAVKIPVALLEEMSPGGSHTLSLPGGPAVPSHIE